MKVPQLHVSLIEELSKRAFLQSSPRLQAKNCALLKMAQSFAYSAFSARAKIQFLTRKASVQ